MKTIFSVCSGIGSIFQIFPLTVNQRPETATLLPSGLVYLLLCFLSKVSTHHLLRLFNVCLLLKRKNWCLWNLNFCFVFTYNLLLWRSKVNCNRCNIVPSHKCLTYSNQTFCTMSFSRKLIKFFWVEYFEPERPCLFWFLRGRRADFKARAILVLTLRTANLL